MKESELYIRLGVQGKCELEKILGFETKYNEQNTYFEILRKKPIVDRLIGAKFQGWRTMLDGGITNSKSQKLNLTMKLPKENPQKINGQNFFHRGHILAKEFYNFIPNKDEASRKIKSNSKNGFIQFSVANMQQSEKNEAARHSQAYYENRVAEYLTDTKNKMSYEVRIYFYNSNDQIPIGTRVSFKTEDKSSETELCNDIFIPNFDEDFDLSRIQGYLGRKSYREFYANGYNERYKKCFKNIAMIDNSGSVSRTFDENHNQIFYCVKENKNSESGLFLTCKDAYRTYHIEPEDMLIESYTKEELFSKYHLKKCCYYPAKKEGSNISAIFFDWLTVESLPGFAMRKLKKQKTLEEAFKQLNW